MNTTLTTTLTTTIISAIGSSKSLTEWQRYAGIDSPAEAVALAKEIWEAHRGGPKPEKWDQWLEKITLGYIDRAYGARYIGGAIGIPVNVEASEQWGRLDAEDQLMAAGFTEEEIAEIDPSWSTAWWSVEDALTEALADSPYNAKIDEHGITLSRGWEYTRPPMDVADLAGTDPDIDPTAAAQALIAVHEFVEGLRELWADLYEAEMGTALEFNREQAAEEAERKEATRCEHCGRTD